MGQEINRVSYKQSDYGRFYKRLEEETILLEQLIKNNACSSAAPMAGTSIVFYQLL